MTLDPEICLDLDRTRRIGMPEAIYCQGKSTAQCVTIIERLLCDDTAGDAVVATRATPEQFEALGELGPTAALGSTLTWQHRSSTGFIVAIVAAGTSDVPVVQETGLTLEALGHTVVRRIDVGVAGLQRLVDALPSLEPADVVVAIAGMEGALPTVLAGLVPQPIVAVPTSVGYGASFEGATALVSMVASCAPGIVVVGIDNGYGAACAAHRISRLRSAGGL